MMTTDRKSEAKLDEALRNALIGDASFATWFLGKTAFANPGAQCDFCRFNNPWSRVTLERLNVDTGEIEAETRDCETDVLAVYEAEGRRIALHIENKLAGGSFTSQQPELYAARVKQWAGRKKLGSYAEATTVLIAPRAFYERFPEDAKKFETFVSHEEIAEYLPVFADAG